MEVFLKGSPGRLFSSFSPEGGGEKESKKSPSFPGFQGKGKKGRPTGLFISELSFSPEERIASG